MCKYGTAKLLFSRGGDALLIFFIFWFVHMAYECTEAEYSSYVVCGEAIQPLWLHHLEEGNERSIHVVCEMVEQSCMFAASFKHCRSFPKSPGNFSLLFCPCSFC